MVNGESQGSPRIGQLSIERVEQAAGSEGLHMKELFIRSSLMRDRLENF